MQTIQAKPISTIDFAPYGSIGDIHNPGDAYALGNYPCSFHRDMVVMPIKDCTPPSFGSLKLGVRPMVIEDIEFHSSVCEIMMPLDDDMVIYVAPANDDRVQMDKVEAFIVPKDVLVLLKAGVWHGAPYPIHHDGTVLICLPERTYFNDTKKYILPEDDRRLIKLP